MPRGADWIAFLVAAGPSRAHLAPSLAGSISLDLFTPHYNPPNGSDSAQSDDNDDDDDDDDYPEPAYYTHPCRCSGTFTITTDQLEKGEELIQCDGCTERCKVEYEVLEDEQDQR